MSKTFYNKYSHIFCFLFLSACLWQPIDLAGDFNTQLKALKILSQLLKHLDETRQNEELKSIKWTNLNLFQDKLKTIVQETKLQHVLENVSLITFKI